MPGHSFHLNPETRCGYPVDAKTKKLWAVELDLFRQLKRICEKHQISYYAGAGTLLGAVRHQGFIPWDDDMDILMLAKDYERFCQVAPQELSEPYFFQHYTTQAGCGPAMARIRNSNTTGCTKFEYARSTPEWNCGIFIDIFPLYNVAQGKLSLLKQKSRVFFYRLGIKGYERKQKLLRCGRPTWKQMCRPEMLLWNVLHLFMDHQGLSKRFDAACAMVQESDQVGMLSFFGFRENFIWPKQWWKETVLLPFEDEMIACPKGYDQILTRQYGDYRVFKRGTAVHSLVVFDPDMPYRQKLQESFRS